jgi:CRP/FNR family cyclic AMP-dependent transcriptional regulator
MANRLGCSREMVSRLMKDLERGGYVEVRAQRIVLMKVLPQKW